MIQENELTSEQSLAIISQMINKTKGNMRNSSFYFLFWGWIIAIASVGHFILDQMANYDHPYIVWLITIPSWIITIIYSIKKSKQATVKTYGSQLTKWVWFGFAFCVVIIITCGSQLNYQITALILLFAGFATFINGLIIKFRPLIVGGIILGALTPAAIYSGIHYAPLVMCIAIIIGYLIPGYMLKYSK